MNELKPCPFCGGEAEVREYAREGAFSIEYNEFFAICKKCGCAPFTFVEPNLYYQKDCKEKANAFRKKAIEAWNRRADNE